MESSICTIKKPKVSVIMGIFNCAPYLQEALDSLYSQTFQDFEIILCEDGSTDNTYEIAAKNAAEHSNIVLLRNDCNLGLNKTLNNCLAVAQGEYIARMDGDDVCDSTRFEKQMKFLKDHPDLSFCSCPMYMFDEEGKWGESHCVPFPTKEDVITHIPSFTHAAAIIRTFVLREVGGYTISKNLLRVEDCHLWFKLYAAGHKGGNLQEPLYGMRDDRSATARRNWTARRNGIYVTWCGYRMFHMPWFRYPKLIVLACIEVVKYLMPHKLYEYFHRKRG